MIACLNCRNELEKTKINYQCERCGYTAPVSEGIVCFQPDVAKDYENYNAVGLDILYRFEQKHFWFKNRRAVIADMFAKHIPKEASVLEIGAGTGNVARMLLDLGYLVSVGDIHYSGLEYAATYGVRDRYQFDLLSPPFQDHFDTVAMFDVLEHFADEDAVLRSISSILRPGGTVILTVPAHSWLWNRDDEIAFHKRRYTTRMINELFSKNNFDILESKHFFVAILPLLYLRTILHPARRSYDISKEQQNSDMSINPAINLFLDTITRLERLLLKPWHPCCGGSIICVARKRQKAR